ncbi:MAG: sigma 54-interacting transcriptional regulator [Bacteroidales bacterium]|nr:sigma 54-interacting transcriptional regulator [Bacteroidales bacterium]
MKKNRKFDAHSGWRNDPVLQLIEEAEENPAMEEIRESLLGNSYDIRLARTLVLKAANSTEPVLILGESGTGKDVVAKQIVKHDKSSERYFQVSIALLTGYIARRGNCLAIRKESLPVQILEKPVCLLPLREEQFFWMKWANCPLQTRPNFYWPWNQT